MITNETIREASYRIADAMWVLDNIEKLPNCNNCLVKDSCKHVPKAGEMTRLNCFGYIGDKNE